MTCFCEAESLSDRNLLSTYVMFPNNPDLILVAASILLRVQLLQNGNKQMQGLSNVTIKFIMTLYYLRRRPNAPEILALVPVAAGVAVAIHAVSRKHTFR